MHSQQTDLGKAKHPATPLPIGKKRRSRARQAFAYLRFAIATIPAVLALAFPFLASGNGPTAIDQLQSLRLRAQAEDERQLDWRTRHNGLHDAKTAAEAQLAQAEEQYRRARRLRWRRGGPSTAEAEIVNDAQAFLDTANAELAEFYRQARSQQVPPGWIRHD